MGLELRLQVLAGVQYSCIGNHRTKKLLQLVSLIVDSGVGENKNNTYLSENSTTKGVVAAVGSNPRGTSTVLINLLNLGDHVILELNVVW